MNPRPEREEARQTRIGPFVCFVAIPRGQVRMESAEGVADHVDAT